MTETTQGPDRQGPGYHLRQIKKGTVGELSKIFEELDELEDAEEQNVRIMALVELSDMYGSIERYLEKYLPSITIKDLDLQSKNTSYVKLRQLKEIPGCTGNIRKELNEAQLAETQGLNIQLINELVTVYGAMQLYLETLVPGMTMEDLRAMKVVTRRAFENGHR